MSGVLNTIHPHFDSPESLPSVEKYSELQVEKKIAHHRNFSKAFCAVQQNVPVFISVILQSTNEKIYECSWSIQAFK